MLNLDVQTMKTIGISFGECFHCMATYCQNKKVSRYNFLFKLFLEHFDTNGLDIGLIF